MYMRVKAKPEGQEQKYRIDLPQRKINQHHKGHCYYMSVCNSLTHTHTHTHTQITAALSLPIPLQPFTAHQISFMHLRVQSVERGPIQSKSTRSRSSY